MIKPTKNAFCKIWAHGAIFRVIYTSNKYKSLKNHYILLMKVTFGKSVMQVVNFQRVPVLFILLSAHSLARKRLNKYAFKKMFKLDGCFKLEV